MPAQQHLAARSAVEEDHGRRGLERLVGRQEKLSVNGEAVGGGEDHLLRRDHVLEREIGGNGGGVQVADAGVQADGGVRGMLRRRSGGTRRCRRRRGPLDALPGGERDGGSAGHRDFPEVAAVGVALVGGEHDLALAGGKVDVFHFESARGEQRGFSAFRGNGIEMRPAVALPGEDDAAAIGPQQLVPGGHFAEHAAGARGGAPDFAARAGLHGGHADGPRLAGAVRLANGPQSAAGDSNEGDAAAIGRPFGLRVGIGAGVEIAQRLRGRVVHANEAVIAAAAHESDARAIGRPDRSRALAARLNVRAGASCHRRTPTRAGRGG